MLEAMAIGIPCISTDCPCGGPRMVINDGENGLLTDREHAMVMGQNARQTAQMFKLDVIYSQWQKYVDTVFTRD